MPITLGCPSCGKRFRARDESAGKRVKCPFCQAAVSVSSQEEASEAAAPTEVVPVPPGSAPPWGSPTGLSGPTAQPPARPAPAHPPEVNRPLIDATKSAPVAPPRSSFGPPPPAAPVSAATPSAWGADPPPIPLPPSPPAPVQGYRFESEPGPTHNPFAGSAKPSPVGGTDTATARSGKSQTSAKAPSDPAPAAWQKTKAGLFWVLFALFWIALIGAVPFGKLVYDRGVGPLPTGEGWVKIDGYVNSDSRDSITITKSEELDLLLYGVPVLLGGLALVFGRLTCGAAPRNSGAKGLFVLSGMFSMIGLVGILSLPVFDRMGYAEVSGYARQGAIFGLGLAEVWFVVGLAAIGATLRRPKVVRAAGMHAVVLGLALVMVMTGWGVYLHYGVDLWPPIPKEDRLFIEAAAKLLGWLILVGTAWRAVVGGRSAIRDYLKGPASIPV